MPGLCNLKENCLRANKKYIGRAMCHTCNGNLISVHLLGLLLFCSMHSPADSTINVAMTALAMMAITGIRHDISFPEVISGGSDGSAATQVVVRAVRKIEIVTNFSATGGKMNNESVAHLV